MGSCTYPYHGVSNAFVAEAKACERAPLFASNMIFRRSIVEGDSLSVIRKAQSRKEDKSVLRPIIRSIFDLGKKFKEISYQFIPRESNEAT